MQLDAPLRGEDRHPRLRGAADQARESMVDLRLGHPGHQEPRRRGRALRQRVAEELDDLPEHRLHLSRHAGQDDKAAAGPGMVEARRAPDRVLDELALAGDLRLPLRRPGGPVPARREPRRDPLAHTLVRPQRDTQAPRHRLARHVVGGRPQSARDHRQPRAPERLPDRARDLLFPVAHDRAACDLDAETREPGRQPVAVRVAPAKDQHLAPDSDQLRLHEGAPACRRRTRDISSAAAERTSSASGPLPVGPGAVRLAEADRHASGPRHPPARRKRGVGPGQSDRDERRAGQGADQERPGHRVPLIASRGESLSLGEDPDHLAVREGSAAPPATTGSPAFRARRGSSSSRRRTSAWRRFS